MASYLREGAMMERELEPDFGMPGGGRRGGATTEPVSMTPPPTRAVPPTVDPMPGGGMTTDPVEQIAIPDPMRPNPTDRATTQPIMGDEIPGGAYIPPERVPDEMIPDLPGGPPPIDPPIQVPPSPPTDGGDTDTPPPDPTPPEPGEPSIGGDAVPLQDLYPEMPETGEMGETDVPIPTEGADVTEADPGVTDVGTPGVADTETGAIVEGAIEDVLDQVGSGEQVGVDPSQLVDAELARILGQDSPLLQRARAEAMRQMNQRGLMNTSMAAGATYGAMVDAAMPMAQQNADQAFQRAMENARLRQEAGLFSAEEISRLRALEAELGQDLSIFNAEQLNEAERLAAELRTAIEQGNAEAYNEAALQLAELQRDAEAQQAELDYAAEEREFLERQAYNESILDAVAQLNERYMIGEQQIDLAVVNQTYNQLISTNETAARIYDSYLRSIGNIFDNPDMTTAQANEAIRAMVSMLEASMEMMNEINGLDLDTDAIIPGGSPGGTRGGGGGGGGGGGQPGGGGRGGGGRGGGGRGERP